MSAHRSLSWPLILITIGLVFLLVNFGYVPGVTAIQLLNLWPLLLILAGVDIAIGRRWPLAALGIDVAVIALGLTLLATQPTVFSGPFFFDHDTGGVGQRDVSVERRSATSLSLDINGGAGRFRVSGGSTTLVEAHSPNEDLRLRRADFDKAGEHADVRIDHSGRGRVSGVTTEVEARVASNVPTDLELNGGAGEFLIDLSDVMVSSAELNVGAASVTLTLPRPTPATAEPTTKPTPEVRIEVNAGASNIIIDVPEGVEVRVTTTGALLSLRSTNARVIVSGSTAETAGYGSAAARVTVRVTAGASSITIR
ncbi:MAG TPA: DUF5668 domain-containing protein [Candidatus Limnocylindria bacterium]|nr:DUF5668 domain-containing protein [Candidatus Limnocylindria bacterium]